MASAPASSASMWEKPRPLGDVPAPRHGHTAVALVGLLLVIAQCVYEDYPFAFDLKGVYAATGAAHAPASIAGSLRET